MNQGQKTVDTTRRLIHLLGFDPKRFGYAKIKGANPEAFIQAVNEFIDGLPSRVQPQLVKNQAPIN